MKLYQFLLPLAALVLISLPLINVLRGMSTGKKARRNIILNLCAFFGVCALAVAMPVGGLVSAAGEAAASGSAAAGMAYIAAALSTGLSALGAAPAAIGAVSEDPKSFAKALIFVVLGEGIAIYGLLISILILNRV